MTFKLVERIYGVVGITNDEVAINNYGATFGAKVCDKLENFSYCEVYLDKENRRVGFKPTNNNISGFKIAKNSGKLLRKSISGNWATQLPSKRFIATYDDDMIIINDCEVADKKPNQPKAQKE